MRECGDILTEGNAHRQEVYDRVNTAWNEYINDVTDYEGHGGAVKRVPNDYAKEMKELGFTPVPLSIP